MAAFYNSDEFADAAVYYHVSGDDVDHGGGRIGAWLGVGVYNY